MSSSDQRIDWRRRYLYLAFFLSAILPAGLYFYSTRRNLDRQREEQALQGENQLASLSAALLQEHLQQGIAFMQAYASRVEFRQSWQSQSFGELTGYLKEAHSLQPDFISFQAFDLNGTLRAIYPPDDSLIKHNFSSQDWYQGISRNWNPYVSELFQVSAKPYPIVAVAVPLRDTKGRPIGILMAPYALGKIADWLTGIEQQGAKTISLVDQKGHLTIFPAINGVHSIEDANGYEPVRSVLDGKSGTGVFWRGKEKLLVAYKRIPEVEWGILVEEPATAALQTTRVAEVRWLVFGLTFVALAMGCGVLLAFLFRQLRHTQEELGESGERYRLIFDHSPQPILVFDLETTGFLTVNDAAIDLYGYSREEFYSVKLCDMRPPEEITKPSDDLTVHREGTAMVNARHKKKGGAVIDVEIYSCLIHLEGKPAGLALVNDITERKRAEDRLRNLNLHLERQTAELEAANNELEAFTYSASHDLRAPLRHIAGFSQILVQDFGPQLEPEALGYLQLIQESTKHMGLLVDDLLQLSRIGRQDIHREPTGLNSLVEEVVRELQPDVGDRNVEWHIDPLPFVECDPTLIKQVFANLLSNAVKFTRPRERALIEVNSTAENGYPVFAVRDNGVGFSMKYADRLFGVFQRLHRQEDFNGTGVGLATVQRIVHKHGGRIWAESEVNKGACFYFTLC